MRHSPLRSVPNTDHCASAAPLRRGFDVDLPEPVLKEVARADRKGGQACYNCAVRALNTTVLRRKETRTSPVIVVVVDVLYYYFEYLHYTSRDPYQSPAVSATVLPPLGQC